MKDSRRLLNKDIKQLILELNDTGRASYASIENAKNSMLLYISSCELSSNSDVLLDNCKLTIDTLADSGDYSNADNLIAALRRNKACIEILVKLRQQKTVMLSESESDYCRAIELLNKEGLLLSLEIETHDTKKRYYALSKIGSSLFNDKDACKKLKGIGLNYTVPSWDLYDHEAVDDSFYYQSICIHDFMTKADNSEYFSFTFPECNNLVFACSFDQDKADTYYCSPYRLMSKEEKALIYKVIHSKDIKTLTVICQSGSSIEKLARQMNFSEEDMSKVKFYSLEDLNE